jgi:hypothetical protein
VSEKLPTLQLSENVSEKEDREAAGMEKYSPNVKHLYDESRGLCVRGSSGQSVKLTVYLYLVPWLRIHEATPLLHRKTSYRAFQEINIILEDRHFLFLERSVT